MASVCESHSTLQAVRMKLPAGHAALVMGDTRKLLALPMVPPSPTMVTVKGTPMKREVDDAVMEVTLFALASMQPTPGPYVVMGKAALAAAPLLVAASGRASNTRSVIVVVATEFDALPQA